MIGHICGDMVSYNRIGRVFGWNDVLEAMVDTYTPFMNELGEVCADHIVGNWNEWVIVTVLKCLRLIITPYDGYTGIDESVNGGVSSGWNGVSDDRDNGWNEWITCVGWSDYGVREGVYTCSDNGVEAVIGLVWIVCNVIEYHHVEYCRGCRNGFNGVANGGLTIVVHTNPHGLNERVVVSETGLEVWCDDMFEVGYVFGMGWKGL